jgi:CDP-glucose 4,6-dehydratase
MSATAEVIEQARQAYGGDVAVQYGSDTAGPHEAGWLAPETAKVRATLGLTPRWALTEAIQRTMAWYRAQQQGGDARALCHSDLRAYHAHEEEV